MNKIRSVFRRITLREQLLVLLFTLVILILWSANLTKRVSQWNSQRLQAETKLTEQAFWFESSDSIASGLERALERVDPQKTYSGPRLSGQIDNILRKVNLSTQADIDPVRTREGEIFNDHNIRVKLNRISMSQLIDFHKQLSEQSPYITLQNLRLNASSNNPEQLEARLEINSFDLKNQ